jgi:hypothetical protein
MTEFSHAIRLCRNCKLMYQDENTLQMAMLSSADPFRAICGEYFKADFTNRKPCPMCQLRFGLKFSMDVCSMCEGVEGLDD